MSNSLKALIVVLPLFFGAFFVARVAFANVIDRATVDRWRNAFLVVTIIGFLTPNFWAMLFFVAVASLLFAAREPRLPALYLVLLCALPPEFALVPGFAGMNYLLLLSPQILLAFVLLGPAMANAGKMRREPGAGGVSTDTLFLLYILLLAALSFRDTTVTNGMRATLALFATFVAPYYAISRWIKTSDDVKAMTAAVVLPVLALSAVAIAELLLSWHFYAQVTAIWKTANFHIYTERSGFVRVYASLINPISFGYMVAVATILSLPFIGNGGVKKFWGVAGLALFGAALFATLSRGPWLGAALGVGVYFLIGPRGFSRAIQLALGGAVGFAALLPTPVGRTVYDLLPFVGEEAGETISYRQELFETGWAIALRNPVFGSTSFTNTAEMQGLVQGQGIVDYVNSYLLVVLESGFVGLALFLGVHLTALAATFHASRKTARTDPVMSAFCRAYFAAHLAVLFMIATTSSVAPLSTVNFIIAALGLGVSRAARAAPSSDPVAGRADAPPGSSPAHAAPASAGPTPSPVAQGFSRPIPKHLRQYVRD
ncbi:MAG: O-antigen ligase family protein [Pseudomonadota bacterium]